MSVVLLSTKGKNNDLSQFTVAKTMSEAETIKGL
jgi:hypothetical protein